MSPPAGVVSPNCSNNRDNESKKRKANVDVNDIDPIRQMTMPVVLLQNQSKYFTFLCSNYDAGENGNKEIPESEHLKNVQVMVDNLERQGEVLRKIHNVEKENANYSGLIQRMKLVKYNGPSCPLPRNDTKLVIKDANDTIGKNSKKSWFLHQNLNSIVEALENELAEFN